MALAIGFIAAAMASTVFAAIPMSDAVLAKFAEQERHYQLPEGIMAKIARIESGGNVQALNGSTQAGGLFQWIPRYWYDAARKMYQQQNKPCDGGCNPQSRFNPFIATEVTAYSLAYTRSLIGPRIQQANADISVGLYMGHFLGAAGAGKFFAALAQNPNASAAQIFPTEARYNGGVFNGRTIAGVYNYFAAKMNQPGITGVTSYTGTYAGPTIGRMMDPAGNAALSRPYTQTPPAAPYRTYPTTYNEQEDSKLINASQSPQGSTQEQLQSNAVSLQSRTSSALIEPPSLIIAQPRKVLRGDPIVVSWTSLFMSATEVCTVSLDIGGTKTLISEANEGTKILPTKAGPTGKWDFTLQCTNSLGSKMPSQSVSIPVE